jgi:CRP/FNR family transcriptional regulator, cyclic AMP receptor protein
MIAPVTPRQTKGPAMSMVQSDSDLYGLLARAGEVQRWAPGGVVFEKGSHGDVMYVVVAGTVVLKDGENVLDSVGAPGIFGELALIESKPRALTAVAETEVGLVEIPVRTFWVLVHETPYFAQLVMRVMAERLRNATGT